MSFCGPWASGLVILFAHLCGLISGMIWLQLVCSIYSGWDVFVGKKALPSTTGDSTSAQDLAKGMALYLSRSTTKQTKWLVRPADLSLLSAWRNIGSLAILRLHSEDSDQSGPMPRLIFAERTCHFVGFVVLICHLGRVWFIAYMIIYCRKSCLLCKQCRSWSEIVF